MAKTLFDRPNQQQVVFSRGRLVLGRGKCLQNGGAPVVRLTSHGESTYFSKLVSSFWQIGTHDPIRLASSCVGIELAFRPDGWIRVCGQ
jgi:hypothetical protein